MRSTLAWAAAKILGRSPEESFKRKTARLDRIVERERDQARRDVEAFRDIEHRHFGVTFTTFVVAAFAWRMDLPWWQIGLIAGAFYSGLNMTAGVAWRRLVLLSNPGDVPPVGLSASNPSAVQNSWAGRFFQSSTTR
jgi:hypothetical protein